jgi:hypothetical protein
MLSRLLPTIAGCLLLSWTLAEAQQRCFPEITCRVTAPPSTETIAAGATITADACGSVKNVTASAPVTTSTTNTFSAPETGSAGCVMTVCNQGTNTITLDSNANFPGSGAANVALTADDCVVVAQTGTRWMQASAVLSNN